MVIPSGVQLAVNYLALAVKVKYTMKTKLLFCVYFLTRCPSVVLDYATEFIMRFTGFYLQLGQKKSMCVKLWMKCACQLFNLGIFPFSTVKKCKGVIKSLRVGWSRF